ncbi:MAG: DUF4160 domain-containing protein [Campylobacterales bacterium]|nr:DUF4160 domain-containing protein [Campylobacterales bacterium]
MPIISYFFGITIRMYHGDHPPSHIHVEYQGFEAFLGIEDAALLKGSLPKKAYRLVAEWIEEHKEELRRDWECAQRYEPLEKIKGADND